MEVVGDHVHTLEHQHRVAHGDEVEHALAADLRHAAPQGLTQTGPGAGEVDLDRRHQGLLDRLDVAGDLSREAGQDPGHGPAQLGVGHGEVVVQLHHLGRLDEDRVAGARGVVHDADAGASGLGPDRQHVAVLALGDEAVLEHLGQGLALHQLVEGAPDAGVQAADASSQVRQLRVLGLGQLARGVEAAHQAGRQLRVEPEVVGEGDQGRAGVAAVLQVVGEALQGLE